MKRRFHYFRDKFFRKELRFRVRLFNVLAVAGILISILSGTLCLINGEGVKAALINYCTTGIALILLLYASRTGKYQFCYLITILTIFLIFFPIIFFIGGGYTGAMPFYFVFAVVFTIFMLEGKTALIIAAMELIVYVGLCFYAFFYPEAITKLSSDWAVLLDRVAGFVTVSIALGTTMYLHFQLYNRQQKELEAAKEEAIRYSEAKSSFLANMSHEIRTPINVMLGMNEMILRESTANEIINYSKKIQNAGKTLLLLINNVLDMSGIEAGKISIKKEEYDLIELIDYLSLTGKELANRKGLSFQVFFDENLPAVLMGDFIHIKQIIVNFISNAVKYTKSGEITLNLNMTEADSKEEIILRISIRDTGIGIKQEKISSLFDAFVRADSPQGLYVEGTGLGLAIAKELAELMNGQIQVESEWDKGSIFTLTIPQQRKESKPIGKTAYDKTGEEPLPKKILIAPGGRILVVDDSNENLQIIRLLLGRTMLTVDTVNSGAKCLEAVKQVHYDVIFMDYMMPDMDGIQTLNHLKENPGFSIPVVVLTANIILASKQKLMASGFQEYLTKPVMWQELEAVLYKLLPKDILISGALDDINPEQSLEELKASGIPFKEFAEELLQYGIKLEGGLQYTNNDIFQYNQLLGIFIEYYEKNREELVRYAREKDWKRMKHSVHSLKSRAKSAGADSLSYTAAKLEEQCSTYVKELEVHTITASTITGSAIIYIEQLLPVLLLEWERANEGFKIFVAKVNAQWSKSLKSKEPVKSAKEIDLNELSRLLKFNCQPDALELLKGLMDRVPLKEVVQLERLRIKIEEAEFRQAEILLADYKGGVQSGK